MSNAKHTDGPWRVIPGHSVVHIVAQNDTVCATNRKQCHERHDETDIANARLIAAAPEILAALHELVSVYGTKGGERVATALWNNARAAIAKAEGRTDA